jgi:hypothetical protein
MGVAPPSGVEAGEAMGGRRVAFVLDLRRAAGGPRLEAERGNSLEALPPIFVEALEMVAFTGGDKRKLPVHEDALIACEIDARGHAFERGPQPRIRAGRHEQHGAGDERHNGQRRHDFDQREAGRGRAAIER